MADSRTIQSVVEWTKHPWEVLRFTFDFSPNLLPDRNLASVEEVEIIADDSNLSVSVIDINDDPISAPGGRVIPPGTALLVRIAGGTPGRTYSLLAKVIDDGAAGDEDHLALLVPLHVV